MLARLRKILFLLKRSKMPKDACYKKVKASYDVFPSARASQAIAKCRKSSGTVRKTEAGSSLKGGRKKSGRIQRQVNPVVQVVAMNIADQQRECLQRHQQQSRK